jgi:hypothetical protein
MLSKCANPNCSAPFRYLHEGKLFRVTRPATPDEANGNGSWKKVPQQLEYFWLCDACAARMTLARAENGRIKAVPFMAMGAAS